MQPNRRHPRGTLRPGAAGQGASCGLSYAETTSKRWHATRLQALAGRFEGLEPLVKARTLLAGTFSRPEALAACREQLSSLAAQAQTDDDEWVRLYMCAKPTSTCSDQFGSPCAVSGGQAGMELAMRIEPGSGAVRWGATAPAQQLA